MPPRPLTFQRATPGVACTTAGEGTPAQVREGGGGWVAAGAGGRGASGLGLCLTFAWGHGRVRRRGAACLWTTWPEGSFPKLNTAAQRAMLIANT